MEEYQEYSLRGRVFQKIRDGILKGEYKENEAGKHNREKAWGEQNSGERGVKTA